MNIRLEKTGKIKPEQKVEMLKQTESLINKTHGTLSEQSAIDIFENNNLQEREILLRPKYDNAYTNNYDFTTIRNPNVFSMPIQNVKS